MGRKGMNGRLKGFQGRKPLILLFLCLFESWVLLWVPLPAGAQERQKAPPPSVFIWNQDSLWESLEAGFRRARNSGCEATKGNLDQRFRAARGLLEELAKKPPGPDGPEFTALEEAIFGIAPLVAACGKGIDDFFQFSTEIRRMVKERSQGWDVTSHAVRVRLYRLLYGVRAAWEEVVLQMPFGAAPSLSLVTSEPSGTPSWTVKGVKVHSGDILVSRGGAPTSALIARGNDFPGNFSHVAIFYVDPLAGEAKIVESLIERGVIISTLEEYLKDKKLRIMVLRLRGNHPAVTLDPMTPHRAAEKVFREASSRHIPYDFEMDIHNHSKMFCSEVASMAYEALGVRLWEGVSRISSPGLRRWLWGLGVRHFETQEPSDLEYDPQVSVVAEWHDPETLRKDHLDNAVTDAMLEGAEEGDELSYQWYLMPVATLVKGYSGILNLFGAAGPIPEGISPAGALRTDVYRKKHGAIAGLTAAKAEAFEREHAYYPPYWQLVKLAREAKKELEGKRLQKDAP